MKVLKRKKIYLRMLKKDKMLKKQRSMLKKGMMRQIKLNVRQQRLLKDRRMTVHFQQGTNRMPRLVL